MPETPLLASEVTTELESDYPVPVLANNDHLSVDVELKVGPGQVPSVAQTGTVQRRFKFTSLIMRNRRREGGNNF